MGTQTAELDGSYASTDTTIITAANGEDYAYRIMGDGPVPLLLFQHFRGNLDNWDPALIDALAGHRQVVTFDNVGVGSSSGTTPNSIEQMAHDAIAFVDALGTERIDLLGYSIGSFVAQEVALIRPELVNRVILASASPKGARDIHGWAPEVMAAVGKPGTNPDGYLSVFYTQSSDSMDAGRDSIRRIFSRQEGRDTPTTWSTRLAQYDAVCGWGIPQHALLERLQGITTPCFVANGDSDPMIPARYSYLLAGLLPNAQIKIYPDSAHGFLFQHYEDFAADINAFLSD
jgi:pimeloyl-ACP methyl ester carboxylesterase